MQKTPQISVYRTVSKHIVGAICDRPPTKNLLVMCFFTRAITDRPYGITGRCAKNLNLKKGVFCNTPFYNYNNIGCNCFPSEAAAKASGICVKSATMDVGFFWASSCRKGTK